MPRGGQQEPSVRTGAQVSHRLDMGQRHAPRMSLVLLPVPEAHLAVVQRHPHLPPWMASQPNYLARLARELPQTPSAGSVIQKGNGMLPMGRTAQRLLSVGQQGQQV